MESPRSRRFSFSVPPFMLLILKAAFSAGRKTFPAGLSGGYAFIIARAAAALSRARRFSGAHAAVKA
jgi:hypothetical protein